MGQRDSGMSGEFGDYDEPATTPLLPPGEPYTYPPHDSAGRDAPDEANDAPGGLAAPTAASASNAPDLPVAAVSQPGAPVGGAPPRQPMAGANAWASTSQRDSAAMPDASVVGGPHPSLHSVYAEALDGAIALAYADGGELATPDGSGRRLVSRVRFHHPRAGSPIGSQSAPGMMVGLGSPSRPSQPWRPSSTPASVTQPSFPPPYGSHPSAPAYPSYPSLPGMTLDDDADLESQSTQLLPAAQRSRPGERAWRPGEGLMGLVWRLGEPRVMRGDEYQIASRGAPAPDAETLAAPWHIAIPIFRPGSLVHVRPSTDLLGVLTLYRNDPNRPFTGRELELLPLHADRAARAIRQVEVTHQYQSQAELLETFHDIGVSVKSLPQFYERLRDIVRYAVEAPTFGVLITGYNGDVTLDFGERDGRRFPQQSLAAEWLPAWWREIQQGQAVIIPTFAGPSESQGQRSAPGRPEQAETALLGWGGEQPVGSLLAAPLMIGPTRIGALVVASPRAGVYTRERAHVFETLARATAIVVENARLAGEMQRTITLSRTRQRQLSALSNAVLTLNSSLDVEGTVEMLADQASMLTNAQVCAVFLLDDAQQTLIGRAINTVARDHGFSVSEERIPYSWHGLNDALKGEPFVLLDTLGAEWGAQSEMGQLLEMLGMVSCLALPITSQGAVVGALFAYTPHRRHHFQADEIGLLQGLASQGGSAVSNARLYQELQQAYEEQKALDRLKDEFILTVSHEFRTPLTAIEGYVTLISRHGHRLDHAKLSQFAGEIHQATSQLAGMISMLADANRMSNQPLQVTLRPTQLRAVAANAIATQSPEAKERIVLSIPDDLWALADDERLTLVFSNLVSNAIKYSPEQAPCSLVATVASRGELARQGHAQAQREGAPERWVVVSVRDRGPGISPEDQAKLFQKFVRLSQSLTTSVRGTGLGLWICRQYVTAMGGDIWVESAIQQGSSFEFCLPLAAPPTSGV